MYPRKVKGTAALTRPPMHDLFKFMGGVRAEMAEEYTRISARSAEDPGTAGDQAEESWAAVLRDWLPSNYHVVTKGRILGPDGQASPQVDLLVLVPSYPRRLLRQKHYFAGGVVAAFECKLNLRERDWKKTFENAARIKRLLKPAFGTPFDELHQPPFYGLLAHSAAHRSTRQSGKKMLDLHTYVRRYEVEFVEHPREMLDLVCVANEGIYVLNKSVHVEPHMEVSAREMLSETTLNECVSTIYVSRGETPDLESLGLDTTGEIFGSLIHALTRYMAQRDPAIRAFSDYLGLTHHWGGIGIPISWQVEVLSDDVLTRLRRDGYGVEPWSPWAEYWATL